MTAEFLLKNGYTLDATYLAGYTVECTLKALILRVTPVGKRSEMLKNISSGKSMHDPETLNAILKNLNNSLPLVLVAKLRKSGWSTDLRYESGGRDTEKTRQFLETAKEIYEWVERRLP